MNNVVYVLALKRGSHYAKWNKSVTKGQEEWVGKKPFDILDISVLSLQSSGYTVAMQPLHKSPPFLCNRGHSTSELLWDVIQIYLWLGWTYCTYQQVKNHYSLYVCCPGNGVYLIVSTWHGQDVCCDGPAHVPHNIIELMQEFGWPHIAWGIIAGPNKHSTVLGKETHQEMEK